MTERIDGALPAEVDLLVLGSGAGGLTAALTASLAGLDCLVLEHMAGIGGTTALSSGTVWIPDNRAMRAAGIRGDRARAATYLESLIAGRGPRGMWERLLDVAPEMQADLEDRAGILFRPYPAAPDYRQDLPGAAPGWRPLEPLPFDGRLLGPDFAHLTRPLPEMMLFGGMMVTRGEAALLVRADRSPRAAWLGARLLARFAADRLSWPRGTRLVLGNALAARLLHACLARGVAVRRSIRTTALVLDAGRVAGATVDTGGADARIRARRGVVLAGGGFPASPEWRARELPAPVAEATPAGAGAVGRTLELALAAGAALGPSGEDNALWFPSSTMRRRDGSTAVWPHIVLDRAKPGALVVDRTGRRFQNEAVSYHEFVRGMYRANAAGHSVPCWMICDRRFVRRYGIGLIRPRTLRLARHVAEGYLVRADTLGGLARQIGIPADALTETVERFNGFAATGADLDFRRGATIYDRANGDPAHGPNPCLGPVARPPFLAVKLIPTPLGTSRGLAADADARVLDDGGRPIPGLWVCGNDMQSALAGEYPGAGAQLAQAMTFGWIAARDAANVAMD